MIIYKIYDINLTEPQAMSDFLVYIKIFTYYVNNL